MKFIATTEDPNVARQFVEDLIAERRARPGQSMIEWVDSRMRSLVARGLVVVRKLKPCGEWASDPIPIPERFTLSVATLETSHAEDWSIDGLVAYLDWFTPLGPADQRRPGRGGWAPRNN